MLLTLHRFAASRPSDCARSSLGEYSRPMVGEGEKCEWIGAVMNGSG